MTLDFDSALSLYQVQSENPFSKIILTGGNQPGLLEGFILENVVHSRVSEPLTILGSGAAVGFGIAMKKKLVSSQEAKLKRHNCRD